MRCVDPNKTGYIGHDALAANMEKPRWKLVLLNVAVTDTDPLGGEDIFMGNRRVGPVWDPESVRPRG